MVGTWSGGGALSGHLFGAFSPDPERLRGFFLRSDKRTIEAAHDLKSAANTHLKSQKYTHLTIMGVYFIVATGYGLTCFPLNVSL